MTWTCNYLIRLSHAVNGDLLIGTLEANSLSDAQIKLVDFLKEHGMPEANISYNVSTSHCSGNDERAMGRLDTSDDSSINTASF
jgi:hypothetical protein